MAELGPAERRLSGIRLAELPDPAAEAQAIALALREALETPARTAALVTPDRQLAGRVSALLARWGIDADDSAGTPLGASPPAPCCSASRVRRRRNWRRSRCLRCSSIRWSAGRGRSGSPGSTASAQLDLELRGPRPPAGLAGLDAHFGDLAAWRQVRPGLEPIDKMLGAADRAGDLGGRAVRCRPGIGG